MAESFRGASGPGQTFPDGLPNPQKMRALLTVYLTLFLTVIDGTLVNVALPVIAERMHASGSAVIWVINAYQLAMLLALLPLATLGEIYGYREVYKCGLAVFTAASLACACTTSVYSLTIARFAQGVGAAGILSVNVALVRHIVPAGRLGRAIGINATVAASAATLGPTIGGIILQLSNWHWLFAINVPLGLVAFSLARKSLPPSAKVGRKLDFISISLTAGMITGFLTGISHLHEAEGANVWHGIGLLLLCVVCAALLFRRERARALPYFPFDLLRQRIVALSVLTSIGSYLVQMLAFVGMPFMLHNTYHYSPSRIGVMMSAWPLALAAMSPFVGRLTERFPAGLLGATGLTVLAIGMLSFDILGDAPQTLDMAWRMALCGVGFALFQTPNNRAIVSSAPRTRAGAASGMLGTARLIGQGTGTAIVGAFLAIPGQHTMTYAFTLGAAIALLSAYASVSRLRSAE